MSKLKYISTFFLLFSVTIGNVNLQASEIESEVNSEGTTSEIVSEVVSEELYSETSNQEPKSETTSQEQSSETVSEVVSEIVSQVTNDVLEKTSQAKQDTVVSANATKSSGYTGTIDNRVKGNGSKIVYVNGIKTEEIVYKDSRIIEHYWFHSNGQKKLYRSYTYDAKAKKYKDKTMGKYNTKGLNTDYKRWSESGALVADYDYVSSGGKLTKKLFLYENGKTKEVTTYNNGIATDRKAYYTNGRLQYDYNFNSKGVRTNQTEYRSDKTKLFYRTYDSKGKIIKSTKYNSDGSKYRINEYYANGQMKQQTYYYPNGKYKKIETWNSNGVRTKIETWNSKYLRIDYRTYYSNGKTNTNNDYYSNGKISAKKQYYSNGKYKVYNTYYSNGKLNLQRNYNSAGKYTYYRENYSSGKVKKEYPQYYSNGKPVYRLVYTYHSNGVVKTINRRDYTASGKYSDITETYNTSGRQTAEKVSSPSALSYFKSPMRGGYITCQYRCYDGHNGIDFGNTNKTVAIYSTAPGTVVQTTGGCSATGGYLGNNCNYGAGNYVVVKHNYGGKQYFSIYMHLSSINVKKGQSVTTSTKIGNMGLSGNTSGPHLHFELFEDTDKDGLRSDEYRTNPLIYLNLNNTEIKIW